MPIFQSKKFQAAVLAAGLAFGGFYLEFSTQQVMAMVSPLLTFIGGQALADIGKEKAKVENE